jgi:hypothetical protein
MFKIEEIISICVIFLMLYISILLHWLTIQFAVTVLKGQLVVILIDCWCATLSLS